MKLYTKRGDKGETSLIGGTRVRKDDPRVEAYGTVDELMAHVGLLMSFPAVASHRPFLAQVQRHLMAGASVLATDTESPKSKPIPGIGAEEIAILESTIDQLESNLPPLRAFVLPGGESQAVAQTHVARTVARRAERRIVSIPIPPPDVLRYVNRLSDYLFILGRAIAEAEGDPQTPWEP